MKNQPFTCQLGPLWLGVSLILGLTLLTPARLASAPGQFRVVTKTIKTKNLNLEFPQIQGLAPGKMQKMLNRRLKGVVDRLVAKYQDQADTTADAWFEVKRQAGGVISIRFDMSMYAKGAAHPLPDRTALTMNVNTGKVYQLEDLFKPGSNWQKRVGGIINQQIAERTAKEELTMLNPFQGIKPDQSFYLQDSTLVIYFGVYEYTPYCDGFPEFPIPLNRLKDILNPGIVSP